MKHLAILILIAYSPYASLGQSNYEKEATKEALKVCNEIRTGTLLVRIEDYHNDILEYEAVDNIEYANFLEAKAKKLEKRLKEGFEKEYNFSKYVFFYAKDIKKVLNAEFVEFLDIKGDTVKFEDSSYPRYIATYKRNKFMVHTTEPFMHIYQRKEGKLEKIPEPFTSVYKRYEKNILDYFRNHPKFKVRAMNYSLKYQTKKRS